VPAQDLLDYVTLRWLHEGDDFHLAGTTRADQRGESEHGFLPGGLQPLQVQLGQFQELAVQGKRAAGGQRVDVRVPVQEFAATRERVPRWIAATRLAGSAHAPSINWTASWH
jgi:hypothetical protein